MEEITAVRMPTKWWQNYYRILWIVSWFIPTLFCDYIF